MRDVVIVNRNAGRLVDEGPLLTALRRARAHGEVFETASVAELGAAVRRAYEGGPPEVVAFAGGDGTYMAGLSALERERELRGLPTLPRIALLPCGTVSTVARSFGFDRATFTRVGDAARAAYVDRTLDEIIGGRSHTRTSGTLRVRFTDASHGLVGEERVGFIFGAGLVSRFFDAYYERDASGGYLRAAGIVLRVFAGAPVGGRMARRVLTPVACSLEVDGVTAPLRRASLVVASVIDDLGLGMRATYRGSERSDRFHLVASSLGARALAPQLPLVLLGKRLLGDGVDALASRSRLRFDGDDPGAWVLDGDVLYSREVEISVGPSVRIIVPRP